MTTVVILTIICDNDMNDIIQIGDIVNIIKDRHNDIADSIIIIAVFHY